MSIWIQGWLVLRSVSESARNGCSAHAVRCEGVERRKEGNLKRW